MSKRYFFTFGNKPCANARDRLVEQTARLIRKPDPAPAPAPRPVFDEVQGYSEATLKADAQFWRQHGAFISANPRGFGYWVWKPWLVLKTLERMQTDDILFYADAGCEWNFDGLDALDAYFAAADQSETGSVAFRMTNPDYCEDQWTKGDVFAHFGIAPADDRSQQLHATFFLLRKTPQTAAMVAEWFAVAVSQNYALLTDAPSRAADSPRFRENRHDQSIFSLIRKRAGSAVVDWPPLPELVRRREAIFDARNLSRVSELIYSPRVVVHAWTQTPASAPLRADGSPSFFGLGDLVRGTAALWAVSRKNKYQYFTDIRHHPVSRWLRVPGAEQPFSAYVARLAAAGAVPFAAATTLASHLASPATPKDIVVLMTNEFYPDRTVSPECAAFLRRLIQPNDELEARIAELAPDATAYAAPYAVWHCRMGDEAIDGAPDPAAAAACMGWLAGAAAEDIVLSDSAEFKRSVKAALPHLTILPTEGCHVGIVGADPAKVRDTLAEFFIAARAKAVHTKSVYDWPSGFMQWAAVISPHNV
jgi:hypothetical protein